MIQLKSQLPGGNALKTTWITNIHLEIPLNPARFYSWETKERKSDWAGGLTLFSPITSGPALFCSDYYEWTYVLLFGPQLDLRYFVSSHLDLRASNSVLSRLLKKILKFSLHCIVSCHVRRKDPLKNNFGQ